jgi:predicted hotdog family 3-hydroxylacyl-ACP dehydratase
MREIEAEFPSVAQVLPHRGEMVLLHQVLEHDDEQTVCRAEIDSISLFRDADGSVPAWIGLEIMAQCIAAHAGLCGWAAAGPVRAGLLLGTRRMEFYCPRYIPGQSLRIRARRSWGKTSGMVRFDCSIEDDATGAMLAVASLNCFLPPAGSELLDLIR